MKALPKFLAAATLALGLATPALAVDITGAGATFPYPIYAKWAEAYKQKTGVGMNYQSIGSGGGITQIKAKTVDFGASDMPLKPEDLQKDGPDAVSGDHRRRRAGREPRRRRAGRDEVHRAGARRHLSRQDQEVERQARSPISIPGVKLPDEPITVVRRSDGSGTTFIWTDYLSKVSPEWKDEGRRQHRGRVAGRRRRQGQRRRRRVRAADQGLDRLRRVRVRQAEQDDARRGAEQGRPVRAARRRRRSRPPPRAPTGRTRPASTRS